jgi:hypothetical protein
MSRRNLLILGGVAVVVIAGIGIVLALQFQAFIAPKPLTISFATVQSTMPSGEPNCAGGSETGGVAKEILNLSSDDIYVAGGKNPMPDEVWKDYRFTLPYLKNSTRNLFSRVKGQTSPCGRSPSDRVYLRSKTG